MRVDERDLLPHQPHPRLLVDQLGAAGRKPLELALDVGHLERHVVHARAPAVDELPDRRLRAARGEELDPRRRRPAGAPSSTPWSSEGLAQLELGAEEPPVRLDRLVQVGHRDPEVVNAGRRHGADATHACRGPGEV